MRTRRISIGLTAFLAFLLVVVARGWAGLDQIPSDPGYEYIGNRVVEGWRLLELTPYIHVDKPLLASLSSALPTKLRGLSSTMFTHIIWSLCGLVIYLSLVRHGVGRLTGTVSGLLLVSTPWASLSAIGNYGNVRWPIFVACGVVIACEASTRQPRWRVVFAAASAVSLTNPLAPLLLVPLAFAMLRSSGRHRILYFTCALPPLIGAALNLINSDTTGHETRIESFWPSASIFWTSGQFLPSASAGALLALSVVLMNQWTARRVFATNLLLLAILSTVASYQLGGIADRYFVAPAALTSIGGLLTVRELGLQRGVLIRILAVGLTTLLLIPTIRWFSVLSWLRSGPAWSTQVVDARKLCEDGSITEVSFVTSDGQAMTDPVPCDQL